MVQNYYQQNHTTPSWSNDALPTLFPFRATLQDPPTVNKTSPANSTTPSEAPSATSTPPASTSKHGAPVEAIVGGVVGGIALIVLVVGFSLWRRRRSGRIREGIHRGTGAHELPTVPSQAVHEKDLTPAPMRHELGDSHETLSKNQHSTTYELS